MKKVAILAITTFMMSGSLLSAQSYGNSQPYGNSSMNSGSSQMPMNSSSNGQMQMQPNSRGQMQGNPNMQPNSNGPMQMNPNSPRPMNSPQDNNNQQLVYTQWSNGPFYADGAPVNAQPNIPQPTAAPRGEVNPTMNAAISNDAVTTRVKNALKNDGALSNSAKNIQVSVQDGKVTLSGVALNEAEKTKVETMVKQINGVKTVINRLIVPSTPSTR